MSAFWPGVMGRLVAREDLGADEAREAMRRILGGEATPAQVAAFVVALRAKGEIREEVAGLAEAMLEVALPVETPGAVVDTTGTGGDGQDTINVSTMAAIVAAGAGAVVAKQAHRPTSSRCGSADVLEALGVNIALGPDGVARCLAEAGIATMLSARFHPALAHAAGPLQEIGVPTVFDFLGPLTNPARPAAQVAGVADARMMPVVAGVLAERGVRAWAVRGSDGIDEITTTGPTEVQEARGGAVRQFYLLPIEMGVAVARPADLAGGDAAANADVVRRVLSGDQGPARTIVGLNAAAALTVGGVAGDIHDGLTRAAESIDSGRAAKVLERWIDVSNAS